MTKKDMTQWLGDDEYENPKHRQNFPNILYNTNQEE